MKTCHLLFSHMDGNPSGGPPSLGESHVFIDYETAAELQKAVDNFLKDNRNGYRTRIYLKKIKKL